MEKFIILDTETTNTLEDPFAYDIGFAIIDNQGKVYNTYSYVVKEIFTDKELMSSAYFVEKIPMYLEQIKQGTRKVATLFEIRNHIYNIMKKFNIDKVIAHNCRFDYISTNTTQRFLTKSKYRYFFPYGTQFIDTLKMSRIAYKNDNEYLKFCKDNDFTMRNGSPRFTAEILYRYITQDIDFVESHTGLEDVLIEKEIFVECLNKGVSVGQGLLW